MAKRTHILTIALTVLALSVTAEQLLAKKKKQPDKQGVIAGTVFQRTGFALPGAAVTLTPVVDEGVQIKKKDIQTATTDRRGEFAFRVPFGSLGYNVRVEADGWVAAEKMVQSQWDQRVNVSFRLKPVKEGEPRQ